jgi:hypothetical protein
MASKIAIKNRIKELRYVTAQELEPHPLQHRLHPDKQKQALDAALREIGIADALLAYEVDGKLRLIDGHGRREVAPDTKWPVLVLDVNDAEAKQILAQHDALAGLAEVDAGALDALLREVSSGEEALQALFSEMAQDAGLFPNDASDIDEVDTDLPPSGRTDVPDALLPTDNEWGVPLLDLKMQATALDLPCERWGRLPRHSSKMRGTYHFYTDDYKFDALWDDPMPVVLSGCVNVVEPNYSTNPHMPRAVALWGIYRKRWLARYWQQEGIRVLVDLNIEPSFDDLNLLGVPKGWTAYATRGYAQYIEDIDRHYTLACEHAGTSQIVFVVFSTAKPVNEHCKARGYLFIQQENHAIEGRAA